MRDLPSTLADRRRIAALRDAGLLTDSPGEAYDRFTRLAARLEGELRELRRARP